jgi:hypothetical protein
LELQLLKTAVLQPVGRKTARAGYKITNFGTGSVIAEYFPVVPQGRQKIPGKKRCRKVFSVWVFKLLRAYGKRYRYGVFPVLFLKGGKGKRRSVPGSSRESILAVSICFSGLITRQEAAVKSVCLCRGQSHFSRTPGNLAG